MAPAPSPKMLRVGVKQVRIAHRNDVFHRDIILDIVHLCENPMRIRTELPETPLDIRFHLSRRSDIEDALRVTTAAPEGYIPAIGFEQMAGIHAVGTDLHRIERINAHLDEKRDEILHRH